MGTAEIDKTIKIIQGCLVGRFDIHGWDSNRVED